MPVLGLVQLLFDLYIIVLLARVLLSWVQVDPRNPIVNLVNQLTEPLLAPRTPPSKSASTSVTSPRRHRSPPPDIAASRYYARQPDGMTPLKAWQVVSARV